MSHFAKVVGGKVTKVIVAESDYFDNFIDDSPGEWVQTSYNTGGGVHYAPNSADADSGVSLRKNYAGIGYVYDKTRDAFYLPQPHPSWILNEDSCHWESPTPHPSDGTQYSWNESTKAWDAI